MLYVKGRVEQMNQKRTNIYLTARQKKQLEQRSLSEGLPMAEIIRRALDAYLAWDDPTYQPTPSKPHTRKANSSPP
jgi:Ribbon-helix-helix protein, copG family